MTARAHRQVSPRRRAPGRVEVRGYYGPGVRDQAFPTRPRQHTAGPLGRWMIRHGFITYPVDWGGRVRWIGALDAMMSDR